MLLQETQERVLASLETAFERTIGEKSESQRQTPI